VAWQYVLGVFAVLTIAYAILDITRTYYSFDQFKKEETNRDHALQQLAYEIARELPERDLERRRDGLSIKLMEAFVLAYLPDNATNPDGEVRDIINILGSAQSGSFDASLVSDIRIKSYFAKVEPDQLSTAFVTICAIGGSLSIAAIAFNWKEFVASVLDILDQVRMSSAWAATQPRYDISSLVPYFLVLIVILMSGAFVASLYVALVTPSIKGTIGKRRSAENVVKMSASFLVGFAMALLK
jgi:hypothetical protein